MTTSAIDIYNIVEMPLDALSQEHPIDLFVGFLSEESRSTHVLTRVRDKCSRYVMLTSSANENNEVASCRRRRAVKNVALIEIPSLDDELELAVELGINSELEKICLEKGNAPSILLDISSMPREVMASVLATLEDFAIKHTLNLNVAYSLAKYSPPPDQVSPNETVKPVHPEFAGWSVAPGLPVAAIVGLGYEKNKALGAVEYIQSRNWWVFVPTSEEEKYLKKVKQHNNVILRVAGEERTFNYSVHAPLATLSKLESLAASLLHTHKPVFLPFGPKIFFFCSLLVATVHKHCAVWHVSGESGVSHGDRAPSSYVMCLSLCMAARATELHD